MTASNTEAVVVAAYKERLSLELGYTDSLYGFDAAGRHAEPQLELLQREADEEDHEVDHEIREQVFLGPRRPEVDKADNQCQEEPVHGEGGEEERYQLAPDYDDRRLEPGSGQGLPDRSHVSLTAELGRSQLVGRAERLELLDGRGDLAPFGQQVAERHAPAVGEKL